MSTIPNQRKGLRGKPQYYISDPYTELQYIQLQSTLKDLEYWHIPFVRYHSQTINDIRYKMMYGVFTDRGWWAECSQMKCSHKKTKPGRIYAPKFHECGEPIKTKFCPYGERTLWGFLNNWIVNSCTPVCQHFHCCSYRDLNKLNANDRFYRRKEIDIGFLESRKFEPKRTPRDYSPESVLEYYKYAGYTVCYYLIERVVRRLDEEFNVSMDAKFMNSLGIIEGEMTRFRDSLGASDTVVAKQIGFLLYMVELGKMRLGALKSLTVKTKNGTGFVPLVKDIQALIKDAIALMDAHGWTTAGYNKLMQTAKKSARASTLDLLEGKEGVFEIPERSESDGVAIPDVKE
jgi:hypothetical protein